VEPGLSLTEKVSILTIRKYPDPVLSKKSAPVKNIDGRMAGLLHSMVDTMYSARGVGLAAPQVGVLERAIVIDTDPEERGKHLIKLINPEIVESSGEITWEEGCLSLVNLTTEVTRAQRVLVRGWTVDQQELEIEAEDLDAVCLQHEIDHLEGTLLVDHISRLKRDLYRRRLKKSEVDADDILGGSGGAPRI